MIDVKKAAQIAAEYFASLYDPDTFSNLLLEEVDMTQDERFWLITLGYSDRVPPSMVAFRDPARNYKTFMIDAETGAVKSMKIRTLADG